MKEKIAVFDEEGQYIRHGNTGNEVITVTAIWYKDVFKCIYIIYE